jgi:hypothetical protein
MDGWMDIRTYMRAYVCMIGIATVISVSENS